MFLLDFAANISYNTNISNNSKYTIWEVRMNNFNKPTVFWSWNNVITPAEAVKQVQAYAEAGVGGVLVHARNVRIPYYNKSD